MNAKHLKDSILQYAIQGKLVHQDPNEETASELLNRIAEEKQHLVKAGLVKKEKPLPPISEGEIPFDIPESWKWVRLGDVLEIARGGSPRPINAYLTDSKDGVNWIKIGDTEKGGKYISSTNQKIIREGMKKSRYVKKGDFLLSNSMSFGRPYILNIDGCIHDGWLVLSQDREIFYRDYLYYLLSSTMVFNQFSSIVSGAVVNNLNSDKVKITLVPLPPLEEQKRIVAKIEELMPYVDQYDNAYLKVEKLNKEFPDAMQKSILQYAMQGKLIEQYSNDEPVQQLIEKIQIEKEQLIKDKIIKKETPLTSITEEEIPFDIPSTWQWVRLGDISTKIHYGYTASAADKGNAKLLRITDIQNNLVNWGDVPYCSIDEKKLESMLLKERDILIARTGGTIGKSFLIKEVNERSVFASYLIRVQLLSQISEDFISYYLRSPLYWNQLIEMSAGTGQPNVNAQNLKLLLVPIPPLEEQFRIVTAIEQMLLVKNKLNSLD